MSIVCKECEIQFSNISNLRAHIKRKHPDRLEELAPKKIFQSVVACEQCDKTFVNNSNLKIHMKSKHSDNLVDFDVKHLKCKICEFSHNCKEELILHFKNSHAIIVENEKIEFASLEDFLVWKNQIEKDTAASFVNMHGSNKNQSFTRTKYSCHRSGAIRRRGNNLRRLKSRGSCKINAFCPAGIDVIIKNGKYEVEFIKTHVGHKQEISKIASKVPFQNVDDLVIDVDAREVQESSPNLQQEIDKIKVELLTNLATVSSFDELEIIKRNIAPIQSSLFALRQQNAESLDFKIKSSSKIPNSKTSPQKRLFSTRKTSKKTRLKLTKPSNTEALFVELLNTEL